MGVKIGGIFFIAALLSIFVYVSYSTGEVDLAEEANTTSASGYEEESVSSSVAGAVIGPVDLQDTTPGTPQTGHMNIDGTGLFGQVGVSGDSAVDNLTGIDLEHTGTNPRKWQVGAVGSQRKGAFAIRDETRAGEEVFTINELGKVGIGRKLPQEKLDVNGNAKANFFIGDGSLLTGVVHTETDPVFGGSPASGITAPQIADWNTAYTWGDHATAGYLTGFVESDPVFGGSAASGISGADITNWNTLNWGELNGIPADIADGDQIGISAEVDPEVGANTLNFVPTWNGSALVKGKIYDNGTYVGIGTNNPVYNLHVNTGGGSLPAILGVQKFFGVIPLIINDWFSIEVGGQGTGWGPGTRLIREAGTGLSFQTESTQNSTSRTTQMVLDATGNVGINTTAPVTNLHINSNRDTSPTNHGALVIGATNLSNVSFDNNEIMARKNGVVAQLHLNFNGGNVAIGGPLRGNGTSLPEDSSDGLQIGTGRGGWDVFVNDDLWVKDKASTGRLHIRGGSDASFSNGSGSLVMGSETGTNVVMDNNEIIARNNGAPSKLWLNKGGTFVVVPGIQITGGADLSEKFDISKPHNLKEFIDKEEDFQIDSGMVACIDPENPGKLLISSQAYDRTVAGIISGAGDVQPGMLMGQKGSAADGEYPVALTGRVYCKADATYGPIKPGDLLTTSDTPGYVMKVRDYDKAHGATIGKAMSSLDEGTGLVLTLVSLQ